MFGMTTTERSGTPADIAAERAEIEAEEIDQLYG